MEGHMSIVIDRKLMLVKAKTVMKKSQAKRNLNIISLTLYFPLCIVVLVKMADCWKNDSPMKTFLFIMAFAYIFLLWWGICGYDLLYIHRYKNRIKTFRFPIVQQVEFDETQIIVSSDDFKQKLLWDCIDLVCKTKEYWFFGAYGIPIDKRQVTPEQYQFLSEKYKMIAAKKKRF